MDIAISDGDYIPDGRGGFVMARDAAETVQRAFFRLSTRKGAFYPMPGLGSELRGGMSPPAVKAAAEEALRGLDGVQIAEIIPEGDGRVRALLSARGATAPLYLGGDFS